MIQKLRFRMVRLAMVAQAILLIIIIVASNYLSYTKLERNELAVISELERFEQFYVAAMEEDAALEALLEETPTVSEDTAEEVPSSEEVIPPEESFPPSPEPAPEDIQPPNGSPPMDPEVEAWLEWHWTHDRFGRPARGYDNIAPEQPSEEPTPSPSMEPSPSIEPSPTPTPTPTPTPAPQKKLSPEVPYESRYFIVTLDGSGAVTDVDLKQIVSITETEALDYAAKAQSVDSEQGIIGSFRYHRTKGDDETVYLFLDCTRDLETFRNSLLANVAISLAGLGIVLLFLLLFSKKIVQPVAESYQKQKEFISAAGHELRTPLSTISADAEVLEMEIGENEWLSDITTQTKRMAELTNSLLTLSRMDEGQLAMPMLEFPLSDLLTESVASFTLLAENRGLTLTSDIQPMVSLVGHESSIRQLISILMDNAVKYSTGTILVSLHQTGSVTTLLVENSAAPVTEEQLGQFFDRFYRTEASRNSETGGYGLGLSIAKEIVARHGGTIRAISPEENTVRIVAEFYP